MLLSKTQLKAFCKILEVSQKIAKKTCYSDYYKVVYISENSISYTNGHLAVELWNNTKETEESLYETKGDYICVEVSEFIRYAKFRDYTNVSTMDILEVVPISEFERYPNIKKAVAYFELKPAENFMIFNPKYYALLMDQFIEGILGKNVSLETFKSNSQGLLQVKTDCSDNPNITARFSLMSLRG